MITLRKAEERGHFNHGWLNTYHTFSFSQYYDPRFMGYSTLRVINEDRVMGGEGFGTHPHRDMEIVTYVLSGALEHKDSMGNGSVIVPGDVQRMTAGTGITHSEFNHSKEEQVHFLQIWITPEERNLTPSYEQKSYTADEKRGKLRLIASRDGSDNSVVIHQDAKIFASLLGAGEAVSYTPTAGRHLWVQVISGTLSVNEKVLQAGDGAALSAENVLTLSGQNVPATEFLLFDLQ